MAYEIQSTEREKFKKVFIHMGIIHVFLAYMKAIGKFHAGSGSTYLMVGSDLLANGFVNGFVTGTHFNRCRRLYRIVSFDLQISHFESFLEAKNIEISDDINERVKEIFQTSDIYSLNQYDSLFLLMQDYLEYKERTLPGELGKTPQYYLTLVKFINYYLLLSRCIRIGD